MRLGCAAGEVFWLRAANTGKQRERGRVLKGTGMKDKGKVNTTQSV